MLQPAVLLKDWQYIFTLAKCTISNTKVIELQYKIIHRCYATDSIIAKWDHTKSEHCDKCQSNANILHNFALCPDVKTFWESLRTKSHAVKITTPNILTTQDILFGKYKEAKYNHFNHLCLYAKYYIHRQYIAKKPLNINNFITYYTYILSVERQKYTEKINYMSLNSVLLSLLFAKYKYSKVSAVDNSRISQTIMILITYPWRQLGGMKGKTHGNGCLSVTCYFTLLIQQIIDTTYAYLVYPTIKSHIGFILRKLAEVWGCVHNQNY